MTIGEAVRIMTAAMGVQRRAATVDTFKTGKQGDRLRGVVTTFMATHEVIMKTAKIGANLIVTHEPLWYNHGDETGWLRGDAIVKAKRSLLARHGIAVYRAHDTWHDRRPDGVLVGMMAQLGWARFQAAPGSTTLKFPRWSVRNIVTTLRRKLGIPQVRVVGSLSLDPRGVAMLVGAWGGRRHITTLRMPGIEALICGEAPEWETYEYVRDAAHQGKRKALIVLGHSYSEEAGMAYLARWLAPHLPGIAVRFVAAGSPFRSL
jgi:putative NIF3 family GTP cyclohydrolase 1 type 2